jgi:hypothetical protein
MRIAMVVVTLLASVRIASGNPDTEDRLPDPPVAEDPPAVKLFVEGRALLEAGKAAEACIKFEESFKLDSSAAGTMLNLGMCHEAVGRLATAIKWFRRAQTRAAEHKLGETENAAKERTQALSSKIATIKLQVTSPPGGVVSHDGARVDDVDYGRLEVDAGHHAFDLTAPNAPPVKKEIDVIDGTATVVVLDTRPYPPKDKKFELVDRGTAARHRSNVFGVVGLSLVVGSAAVGGVGRLVHDSGDQPDDFRLWKNVVRYGGTSLFVAGAAAITYAVVLRIRAPKKERREVVTPLITRDHVGFAFAKAF